MFTFAVPQPHPHLPVSLDHLQALKEANMSFASAVLMCGYYLGTREDLADLKDPHGIADAFLDERAHAVLAAAAGFTDQWTEATAAAWLDRYKAASSFINLAVLHIPVFDHSHYYLTGAYLCTNGDPRHVIPLDRIPPVTDQMRARLKWGADALGYVPGEPKWMLATTEEGPHSTPAFGRIANYTPTDD